MKKTLLNVRQFSALQGVRQPMALMVFLLALAALAGCTKIPDGLQPVDGFVLERFMGSWYEIARLDHKFERGMENVTTEFEAEGEDGFSVVNRAYLPKSGKWTEETGKGALVEEGNIGSLKISYFGPFYGGYHIIDLDKEGYRYAMVTGPTRSILWILSRDKTMDDKTYSALVAKAGRWGFDLKKMIMVNQNPPLPVDSPVDKK